ncbi:polyphosphate kinase 1 [Microbulbifer thermotolerans]|uniref:polyphosphate kinase 1 n=1 Tax=Microbulbifer thermotolerans TaxID=252514 RepID=UPI002249752E|nr:polyphosphate kinase 1 [Microbulbifer thermotolerans]MCX2781130.1 polyphosphate kinase 1 [Microbulbifer thermotolerans]MCX2782987.1 polyphosphate kinase 1 [Microbulbifer thermotolerans]MCX2795486.1 polyphosphate kinase 1 [Microbulbifer thermotolerans]MCX2804747.1 polyphosphate kinase 1 [Microbulbifer thermotolerans]MCX2841607.1 polyphosphate kinase 1 [Microbulbifer thermotolerans]
MFNDTPLYPKELSWLSFNERVLQEVEDKSVPIIERVRFLGIFSNNLDEFYRVRVADVRRLAAFTKGENKERFAELLADINEKVLRLQRRYHTAYLNVLSDLDKHNIHLVNENQLCEKQRAFVEAYFHREVLPELEPFFIDDRNTMPLLNETSIYFAIYLLLEDGSERFAALEIPTDTLPRFVVIPPRKGRKEKVYIVLDNIIRACLLEVFRYVLPIRRAEAYMFKISRDAELELGEHVTQNILDRVAKSLKKRKQAEPVRLAYDAKMPEVLLNLVKKKLKMGRYDSFTPGGRYHNSKDFMGFPADSARHSYKALNPLATLPEKESVFNLLRGHDQLYYYPYHDFRAITNFLVSAAIDPQVKEIRINLYRVAKNSRVVGALINAARNNKKVIAVVELQARFDELANIHWSNELREAGVQVIFGVPGLKVHCKLISIVRKEDGGDRFYSHLGTGNFNESTARVYCDFSLLTSDQALGRDVYNVFEFIQFPHLRPEYRHIAVSPYTNRPALLSAIDREISAAEAGKRAELFFKCNNLVDGEVIEHLYRASTAGVRVRIIVRSMCSLVCETPGVSDNIQVISLVDKYLEHARVYIFHNGGDEQVWMSSADLMTRNLDHRVEVTFPVRDEQHRRTVKKIMELQWSDNQKARVLDKLQSNTRIASNTEKGCRSQDAIYRYLKRQASRLSGG